jgi:hypothetical protein
MARPRPPCRPPPAPPSELHWYQRAHAECAANARRALPERALALATAEAASRRASGAGLAPPDPLLDRVLTHAEQKKLLLPLLRLRQACCHPQVGASGLRGGGGGGGGGSGAPSAPMSMGEILGVLTSKARTEAEEAQRAVIHALNGLAGLMLIEVVGGGAAAAGVPGRESLRRGSGLSALSCGALPAPDKAARPTLPCRARRRRRWTCTARRSR